MRSARRLSMRPFVPAGQARDDNNRPVAEVGMLAAVDNQQISAVAAEPGKDVPLVGTIEFGGITLRGLGGDGARRRRPAAGESLAIRNGCATAASATSPNIHPSRSPATRTSSGRIDLLRGSSDRGAADRHRTFGLQPPCRALRL
jgi:hypothetical protein